MGDIRKAVEDASEIGLTGDEITSIDGVPVGLTPGEFIAPKMFPHVPEPDGSYHIGRGKVYVAPLGDDGKPGEYKYAGECDGIEIKIGKDERKVAPFVKPLKKSVGDILAQDKAEVAAGKPTMREFAENIANIRLTEAQRAMVEEMQKITNRTYERQFLGKWADQLEDDE
ncbi:MAG: hypothetical protein GKR86_16090 [Ilumatobacter sp.]|nr:hypothetical protein [Ilumatobacter sp.]